MVGHRCVAMCRLEGRAQCGARRCEDKIQARSPQDGLLPGSAETQTGTSGPPDQPAIRLSKRAVAAVLGCETRQAT
jgi:hypothetical protein